jgi:hypothetical protein
MSVAAAEDVVNRTSQNRRNGRLTPSGVGHRLSKLRARHGGTLRMPDAPVIAYADLRKARRVLTADARWSASSRRVGHISG